MAKKEIDLVSLNKAVSDLDVALNDFTPCYKEFVGSVMDHIENFNSDFMVSLEKVLRAFKDDKVTKAMEATSRYAEEVKAIYESWNAADIEIAARIQRGEG